MQQIPQDFIESLLKSNYYWFDFQGVCERLMQKIDKEFIHVWAGWWDLKNDWYIKDTRVFYQMYATAKDANSPKKSTIESKIKEDLEWCIKNWWTVKRFIFLTNNRLNATILKFIENLEEDHPWTKIEAWWPERIAEEIIWLRPKDISFVLWKDLSFMTMSISNEYDIYDEITWYILGEADKLNDLEDEENSKQMPGFSHKVPLNFPKEEIVNINNYIDTHFSIIFKVSEYIKRISDSDRRIRWIVSLIKYTFRKLKWVKSEYSMVESEDVLRELVNEIIPPNRRDNMNYQLSWTGIVLYAFENCDFWIR